MKENLWRIASTKLHKNESQRIQFGSATDVVCFRPIRGEMFIERATTRDFFSLQRSETHAIAGTLRSAGAPLIEFIALSINISPLGRSNNDLLQVEST